MSILSLIEILFWFLRLVSGITSEDEQTKEKKRKRNLNLKRKENKFVDQTCLKEGDLFVKSVQHHC